MTENERLSLPIWKKIIFFLFSFLILNIQIGILFCSIFYYYLGLETNYFLYVYLAVMLVAIGYVLYINKKPMNSNYKNVWSCLILLFPVVFCVLYTMNSSSRRLSKRKRLKIHNAVVKNKIDDIDELKETDIKGYSLAHLLKVNSNANCSNGTKFTFFDDCINKHYDMLDEMNKATKFIYMEFFIISPGKLWDELYDVLFRKGQEGVRIRIIYDSIGSKNSTIKKLRKKISLIPNCELAQFEPLGYNINFMANYRDHRKIIVIDGNIAYCGGDNLADEYIHRKNRFGYWRDNCGKYEGKAVDSFTRMFAEMWYTSTKTVIPAYKECDDVSHEEGYVIPFGDGPLYESHSAYDLFVSMISMAEHSIIISTPYFIIDEALISLIAMKCKSGVNVKILMPHIPDKRIPFYMGRNNYGQILKAGGEIYEFTPGFNHAKNVIIDGKYAFIGTVNFDYRSLFLHYECGALLINKPDISKMIDDYNSTLEASERITYEKWEKRPRGEKVFSFLFNLFAPLL